MTSSSNSSSESRSSESRSIVYRERGTCLACTRASITSYNIRTIYANWIRLFTQLNNDSTSLLLSPSSSLNPKIILLSSPLILVGSKYCIYSSDKLGQASIGYISSIRMLLSVLIGSSILSIVALTGFEDTSLLGALGTSHTNKRSLIRLRGILGMFKAYWAVVL